MICLLKILKIFQKCYFIGYSMEITMTFQIIFTKLFGGFVDVMVRNNILGMRDIIRVVGEQMKLLQVDN